jgi:hypothetical protein
MNEPKNRETMSFHSDESRPLQFFALEYRSEELGTAWSHENVIILLVRSRNGNLDLLVHPAWHDIVAPAHQEYVQDVLSDFERRTTTDPEGLFKQVATLSVGPLVTYAEGADISDNPKLRKMLDSFVSL